MTNEEIEKAVDGIMNDHSWSFGFDGDVEALPALLSRTVRSLVLQAYEEAAQKLDERKQIAERERRVLEDSKDERMYWHADGKEDAFEDAAYVVRALKDSLVSVESAST